MYEGGLEAFVRYLDKAKHPLVPDPIAVRAERDDVTVEASLWWNNSYHENVLCFYQQHPAARRRHAPCRVPRRADSARSPATPNPPASPSGRRSR